MAMKSPDDDAYVLDYIDDYLTDELDPNHGPEGSRA